MNLRFVKTRRERWLLGIVVSLFLIVGVDRAFDALYKPRVGRTQADASRLTQRLHELERLSAHSEEIRERHEALQELLQGANEGAPHADELLERLEESANGRVHLVRVHPEPSDAGAETTRISVEFVDTKRRFDSFLATVMTELAGDVVAFQASVGGRDELRCQATIEFPVVLESEPAAAPEAQDTPSQEVSG